MSHYQKQMDEWDSQANSGGGIPPHADVRVICNELWKLESGLEKIGLAAPWLTKARDMLARMSGRVYYLEKAIAEQTSATNSPHPENGTGLKSET
jgi:hypothetical protein